MSPSLALALLAGVLFGTGVVLLLSRSLVRSLLGVILMSNGANVVYLIASGRAGRAPIVDGKTTPPIGEGGIADPLPQAMVLTAIVITLAVTAFTLALAHRAFELRSSDLIEDDVEGRRAHDRAVANDLSDSDYRDTSDPYSVDSKETDVPHTEELGPAPAEGVSR
ncbi:Na(+)/H(+) antiporter subunit C [Kribbia dieselivorans]|uniref:Na(+)/H(+) antiporter subunit C n=1 Tax=Kribbia dieselivorans TaxID=331526 RepID=UPI0009F8C7B2|nr:Na(+)/H(+) antiporter subunit C [Kribbia dieselivorans]